MRSKENPFKGVNPHLMSLIQTPGSREATSLYPAFHSAHIGHIRDFLNDQLPTKYRAVTETSLQIQSRESGNGLPIHNSAPIPDVTVYGRPAPAFAGIAEVAIIAEPDLVLSVEMPEPKTIMGIGIYSATQHPGLGIPVTRIELLSPANLPGSGYFYAYQENRLKCFEAGTPLIEIDYLHEFPPISSQIPHYPHQPNAHPYHIALSLPQTEHLLVYFGNINEDLPRIPIPLADKEQMGFELDPVYQHTFKTGRYGDFDVDYTQEPVRMETYSLEDQQKIRDRMKEIKP